MLPCLVKTPNTVPCCSIYGVGKATHRVTVYPERCVNVPHRNPSPSPPRPALVRPFRGGAVTHNGVALYREAELKPGDLLGLGNHFLFLYRDPRVTPSPPPALPFPWQQDSSTPCCPGGVVDRQEVLRQYLGSSEAALKFHPRHADALLQVSTSWPPVRVKPHTF